jgi:hypothetical protein
LVLKATYAIESITFKHGGRVDFTELRSDTQEVNSKQISPDSSLETSNFTMHNQMQLRIPNNKLDSALREISSLVSFMDYRIIKVEDVSLELLANKLQEKRNEKGVERILNSDNNKVKANIESLGV